MSIDGIGGCCNSASVGEFFVPDRNSPGSFINGFTINDSAAQSVGGDGSITFDDTTGGDSFCNGLEVIRVLNVRLVITKICGVGEPLLGQFEGHYQVSDGSYCDSSGQFLMYRTQ